MQFLEQTSYNASKEAPITSVWSKDIPNDMEYNDQNLSVTYIWNIIYHDSANISATDYIKKLNEMHYACEKVA